MNKYIIDENILLNILDMTDEFWLNSYDPIRDLRNSSREYNMNTVEDCDDSRARLNRMVSAGLIIGVDAPETNVGSIKNLNIGG